MNADLERRYRRLLRAYPASYRAERGSEILETLDAGAAVDQTLPAPREAATLLSGGLRLHVAGRPRSPQQTWYAGAQLAVMALLLSHISRFLWMVGTGRFPQSADEFSGPGLPTWHAARRVRHQPRHRSDLHAGPCGGRSAPAPGPLHAQQSVRNAVSGLAPAAATGFGFVDRSWMLAGLALALIWAALDAAVTVAVSIVLTAQYLQTALPIGALPLVGIGLAVGAVAAASAVLQTRRLAWLS